MAAQILRVQCARSSVSRSYYACFAACHAIICHLQTATLPARGNFKHSQLPSLVLDFTVGRSTSLKVLKERLEDAYNARVLADYRPLTNIEHETVSQSLEAAQSMVRFAKGVV
jgi:uncharacterized protein (UPF0332 family)